MSLVLRKVNSANAVTTDPWLLARERYLEDLSEEERMLFSEASLENLFYSASAVQKLHEASSRSRALSKKIQPFLETVEEYGKALDVYSNASPMIMGPLWGSIKVPRKIACEFGKYFEKLVDMFARIGDVLPRFRVYERLFPDHSYLLHALSVTYVDIIKFCMDAKKAFRKGKNLPAIGSFKMVWKPFDRDFAEALDRFRIHKENVEKEAGLSHMIESAEARVLEQANRRDELRRRLLKQLPSIDQECKQRKLLKIRYQNTGTWLLNTTEFKHWLAAESSSCLWCYGIPGCGKTILTATIIDHLTSAFTDGGTIIAYYYIDYSDPYTLASSSVLGCLVKQMLNRIEIPMGIAKQIDRYYGYGARTPATEELVALLISVIQLFSKTYVVIDGIDECENQERTDILSLIGRLTDLNECTCLVSVVSREQIDISKALIRYPRIHISHTNVTSDIGSYIDGVVNAKVQSKELLVREHSLVGVIIDALSRGARGMFLWVAFQLDELCEAVSDHEIRDILQKLPKDLAETYTRILRKINMSKGSEKKMIMARKIFQWICSAKRPLLMEELKEAIAFESTDPYWDAKKIVTEDSRLIQACRNLVVFDEVDQTVRLVHYTLQQFLLSAPIDSSIASLHFRLPQAELQAGELCVAYLSFSDFETQITRSNPNHPLRDMQILNSAIVGRATYLQGFSKTIWNLFNGVREATTSRHLPIIDFERVIKLKPPPQDLQQQYRFLNYAIENWLWHTVRFSEENTHMWRSFKVLALEKQTPFDLRTWGEARLSTDLPYLPLFLWAVDFGHSPLLGLLLKPPMGADLRGYLRHEFKYSRSPLRAASHYGHADVLELLLTVSDNNMLDPSLLHFAAEGGHEAVVRLLVERGFDLGVRDRNGNDPLFLAAMNGHEAVVRLLVQEGAVVNMETLYGRMSLNETVSGRLEIVVRLLLERGADLESEGIGGRTPLLWAAELGHETVVKLLLEKGAELETRSSGRQTPLSWAAENGHEAVVGLLLEKGANLESKDSGDRTPLSWAAKEGHEVVVELLIEKGAELETRSSNGRTPLSRAAENGHEAVVKLLLEKGASPKSRDSGDRTPLSWAAKEGYEAVVELLIAKGAELETRSSNGRTSLSWAAENGHEAVVKLLLEKGASPKSRDSCAWTPLSWAAKEGHEAVVELLIEKGAELETRSSNGRTSLSWAAENGHEAVIKLLLKKGASLKSRESGDRTPLSWAAKEGHEVVVKLLIEKGAELETRASNGRTSLSWAAENGHEAVVKLLLDRGADLESKDGCDQTPLSWAAEKGHEAVLELLLKGGSDLESEDISNRTPLLWAVESGSKAAVKLLLENGANLESKDNDGRTPLSRAAKEGHEAVVELLIEKGAELETRTSSGQTPLSWAAESGHEAVVKLLLEKGADLESKDSGDRTPLSRAAKGGREVVVELLIEKGADVKSKDGDGQTPLSWAAWKGHEAILKLLLQNGADVRSKGSGGMTPLLWATESGSMATVKLLLEKGANLESKDSDGRTPLSRAAKEGYKVVVGLLIEKGADLETRSSGRQTPLSWAAENGHKAVVKLLLEKGANLESKDSDGQTPLSRAAKEGYKVVVGLLIEKGADLETRSSNGRTSLSWAAENGHEAVVKLLLEKGADLESMDTGGRTPLSWAARTGHDAVAKLLLEEGADLESKDIRSQAPLSWGGQAASRQGS